MYKEPLAISQKPIVENKFVFKTVSIAYCLLPITFLLLSIASFSQNQDTIKRPKIGLVLSGGGAKGFAHIGVLKVLEQARVKIDYIGGTSMGAVVGGLYSSGYSASQIDSIFTNTNFDELLKDYIPRTTKSLPSSSIGEKSVGKAELASNV